jgi:tetratricopeptide (TPR) repeat protein
MDGSPFVLGLTLGVLTTVVATWSFGVSEAPPNAAFAETRRSSDPSTDGDHATIAQLEAELEALRGAANRESVTDDDASEEPALPPPPDEPVPHNGRLELLIREVDEQLRSGVFHTCYADEPASLAYLVIDRWMSSDQPERALLLLERLGDAELMSYGNWIGASLLERGDKPGAIRAYLLGLQHDPSDWGAVTALANLDPAVALSMRAGANLSVEAREAASFRAQSALLMLAQGQTEAAQAALAELTQAGQMPGEIWESLIDLDASFAAGQLESLRGESAFEENNMGFLLANALQEAGRGAEARETLQKMLEREDLEWTVLERMAELEGDGAVAFLRERVRSNPTPASYQILAQQLIAREDREGAIQALLQARALEPNGGATRQLVQLDVVRFGPEIANSARTSRDDELLGDIADSYWQAGMRDQAIRLWQSAQDFDPGDGEWRGKLEAARSGEDPFR